MARVRFSRGYKVRSLSFYDYKAVVVGWYDGDSPTVDIDLGFNTWLKNQKLRLYGIDTPEMRGGDRPQGIIARDKVREWCPPGSKVGMESHKDESGKYGRWLATIWPDGWETSLNHRLYANGLAEIKTYDPRTDIELRRRWNK